MSYLVLARKYRPATFADVTGQEHVTRTLTNSIKRERVGHAYLFAGPRGVGKTSIARVFAKSLNCADGPTATPCAKCANCTEISEGNNLAVREIDGASHNSVDNVRDLIDSFRSLPPPGSQFKIYIIDEVHMLSTAAFNALLKSLEEPPPNTVFILATTEAHKIPDTVISRCQRHDFRALSYEQIEGCLQELVKSEGIEIEPAALRMIARVADGSMRDAQSALERVMSFCDGSLSAEDTAQVLGVVSQSLLFDLSRAIFSRDVDLCIELVNRVFSVGLDPSLFIKEFAIHWREVLIGALSGKKGLGTIGVPDDLVTDYIDIVSGVSNQDVQDLAQLVRQGADVALRSTYPKYSIEALVVRLATREPVRDLAGIIASVGSVETPAAKPVKKKASSPRPKPLVEKKPVEVKPEVDVGQPLEVEEALPAAEAGSELNWPEFVDYVFRYGSHRMLGEQLKRLSVDTFVAGEIEGKGPEFSVKYFGETGNKSKLVMLLESFSSVDKWRITLEGGSNGTTAEPGSIRAVEQKQATEKRQAKEAELAKHPHVLKLKEVFPGTTIEGVNLKAGNS